jgi:hypothetical protein
MNDDWDEAGVSREGPPDTTATHLGALRGRNHWAWTRYWFRRDVRWRVPARYECISQTRIVATFHATVGVGTICVVWLDDV